MTTIKAIYEAGVLRPLEPLTLAEGQRVEILVVEKIYQPQADDPETDNAQPKKTPAEIMAEISALAIDYGEVDTADVDHDKILYGDVYRKYGA